MSNGYTMMLKAGLLLLAAVSFALFTSASVLAHGSKPHGSKADDAGPVVKEQTLWGIAGDAADVVRTVDVTMGDDMRFQPASLRVKQGETIRFRVKNTGVLLHEFVIGTPEENAKHAELMLKFPGMEHDEPYMAHVDPGEVGEIVWTFNREGTFEFACLIAGHFQAGMVGNITVAAQ
ncbi:plastocyanin/azurin family copper-binding protein [Limnobacter sp.]|uniref:cupredoxin domain-containing protein n=1 Tax=Limnobacter sp. TaxID=2003368 RepID=UPI003513A116